MKFSVLTLTTVIATASAFGVVPVRSEARSKRMGAGVRLNVEIRGAHVARCSIEIFQQSHISEHGMG
jgi:hypothetical protein